MPKAHDQAAHPSRAPLRRRAGPRANAAWSHDRAHVLAYWVGGLALLALPEVLSALGAPLWTAAVWLAAILAVPAAHILRALRSWVVDATDDGLLLLSRRPPARWIPWADVRAVTYRPGGRGTPDFYHFECRGGCFTMLVSRDARRIAQKAAAALETREDGRRRALASAADVPDTALSRSTGSAPDGEQGRALSPAEPLHHGENA